MEAVDLMPAEQREWVGYMSGDVAAFPEFEVLQ